jgi:hypothetical protein
MSAKVRKNGDVSSKENEILHGYRLVIAHFYLHLQIETEQQRQ